MTVFHLPTVQAILLTPPPHDFSAALAAPTVPAGIAAPGDTNGNGGGVSGGNSSFLVATGATELGTALITQGTPGSWTAGPPLTSVTPLVENWYHVLVNGTNAYTSVFADGRFGILAVSLLPMPAVATPSVIQIPGSIGTVNPVQTQFGWHVIRRDESRDSEPPTLESVRDAIKQRIEQQKLQEYLARLREANE